MDQLMHDESTSLFNQPRKVLKYRLHLKSGEVVEAVPERVRFAPQQGTLMVAGQLKDGKASFLEVGPLYVEVIEMTEGRKATIRCFHRPDVEVVTEPSPIVTS